MPLWEDIFSHSEFTNNIRLEIEAEGKGQLYDTEKTADQPPVHADFVQVMSLALGNAAIYAWYPLGLAATAP
jgi:hypothetical protein